MASASSSGLCRAAARRVHVEIEELNDAVYGLLLKDVDGDANDEAAALDKIVRLDRVRQDIRALRRRIQSDPDPDADADADADPARQRRIRDVVTCMLLYDQVRQSSADEP